MSKVELKALELFRVWYGQPVHNDTVMIGKQGWLRLARRWVKMEREIGRDWVLAIQKRNRKRRGI